MGALSVVICAILSSLFLNEKLSFFGWLGCALCVVRAPATVSCVPDLSPHPSAWFGHHCAQRYSLFSPFCSGRSQLNLSIVRRTPRGINRANRRVPEAFPLAWLLGLWRYPHRRSSGHRVLFCPEVSPSGRVQSAASVHYDAQVCQEEHVVVHHGM